MIGTLPPWWCPGITKDVLEWRPLARKVFPATTEAAQPWSKEMLIWPPSPSPIKHLLDVLEQVGSVDSPTYRTQHPGYQSNMAAAYNLLV